MNKRSSLLLTLTLFAFGTLLLNCGGDSHPAPNQSQTATPDFVFLQEVPSPVHYVFAPMLGKFNNGGFSYTAVKSASNGQQFTATIVYSITLGRDGKRAAMDMESGSNNSDIWVINVADASLVQISNDDYIDLAPQLSPDGTKVVYTSYRPMSDGNYHLQTVLRNADGSGGEQVLPIPPGAADQMTPTYSPDGSKLATRVYGVGISGIWIMNADGSNPQMLTNPFGSEHDYNPAFNSDGSKIAFSRWNAQGYRSEDVYIMNADGSNVTKLTEGVEKNFNSDPMFVTVGGTEKLIFASNRDNPDPPHDGSFELYTMRTDGTGISRLTNNSIFDGLCAEYYGLGHMSSIQRGRYQLHTGPARW